ncbi:aspartyl/asparaginyl beta-hydroxylase domain-containing protein [Micromonospora lutea]|uniref:Aspartyl/asparaginy/proline hydroxylase domain-containing protein n=1 Tax=Micromonospora lutea TaxID=419825 RepID=A0ABQ4IT30_9ACTN|nr:aspartyl/asparaginyl beta-hydroxylase domain-containing protein [Micromonospora lutea]GIJ21069.1 hypothetical protein Vlu01_16930 [Micromonospora lutea]
MRTTATRRSQKTRAAYNDLIAALIAEGADEDAQRCAELAVAQGVWRDPQQRPVHYLPSLEPRPVYDADAMWFCAYLEEHYPMIRAELDRVTEPGESGFLPVEEPLLRAGRWEQVTLYEGGQRFDDACARFPVTASIIEGIPEATSAGTGVVTLSWLYPGTHIMPHCGGSNARLRVHLGLRVGGGERMRVGTETLTWEEGRCFVFDDSFEHEVWHDGDQPRVVLLMDVAHPQLDAGLRDLIVSSQVPFEDRVLGFCTERGIRRVAVAGEAVTATLAEGPASQVIRYLRERGAVAAELTEDGISFQTDEAQ